MINYNYNELISLYEIEKISNEVSVIKINGNKLILKRILIPIDWYDEENKKLYIDYLNKQGIKVARIINFWYEGDICYEIQEYIENGNNKGIKIDSIITEIAKYHKASSKYCGKDFNKCEYIVPFCCCGINLNRVLLGFYEKYYKYAQRNFYSCKNVDPSTYRLFKNMEKIFGQINNNEDIPRFICHNDLTDNNILIVPNGTAIIDFDFCYKTIPYVDIVDVILTRNYSIKEIIHNKCFFEDKVKRYVYLYNKEFNILQYDIILKMVALKVISFFFYVHYNDKNMDIFNENLNDMLELSYMAINT